VLLDTIIGIVIVLAAWLIVDVFLSAFTTQGLSGWSQGLFSNGAQLCLTFPTTVTPGGGANGLTANNGVYNTYCQDKNKNCQCADGNDACSAAALQAAGLSETQANIMSCIAVTESSGNPNTPPYNVLHSGSNSTACGTFQVTQTTWNSAVKRANIQGACSSFNSCQNAACNMQVATALVSANGYSDWTCAGCNTKAQGCINAYANAAPAVSGPSGAVGGNGAY
jgi:hypothetical protein